MLDTKNTIKSAILLVILCASAQISFDIGKIPITLQSLVVCLLVFFVPLYYALGALGAYTLLGVGGLPIFADGSSGWGVLAEGSLGYFIGFLGCLIWLDYIKTHIKPPHFFIKNVAAMLVATLIILVCGTAYLAVLYPINDALHYGFYPFIIGGLLKSVAAAGIVILHQKFTFF